jgi:sugar phosphate isomerase/epimerase
MDGYPEKVGARFFVSNTPVHLVHSPCWSGMIGLYVYTKEEIRMLKNALGAQMYTVREHTKTADGVRKTLEKIVEIGYPAVQVSSIGKDVTAKDVAGAAQDTGLVVAGTHVGWERFQNDLDAVIEEHVLWDCQHAAIGGLPGEYFDEGGMERFIDELGSIVEKLGEAGIDFSYHNHSHELVRSHGKTWLATLYEKASPELLKAEIDVYWIQHGGGDPVSWIRQCAGREPLLHLKDMCITPDREQHYASVGEGNLNWPEILQAARESGVKWYLVEQDDCYGADPFEALATSYKNLVELDWDKIG